MTDQPRPRTGAALAAVPHVLLLAWMIFTLTTDRAYAAFVGILEIFIVPVALLAALAARFLPPFRGWAKPIAVTTLVGGVTVILTAILVGGFTG